MDSFLDKIEKQLILMKESEKDVWILAQAKLLPEWKQEDFYKSLCGTKKVIDMPERSEITEFCEKVRNDEITVEYETHYVEFDDYGNFHDDWEYVFYDPDNAMSFIISVVKGCHDLIMLEEYESAFEILDEIIRIEFIIEDHPDTDDSCADDYMDLDMAIHERILPLNRGNLLHDYIEACRHSVKDFGSAAGKIVSAFEMELFRDCKAQDCVTITATDPLLDEIRKKLAEDLVRFQEEFNKKIKEEKYYRTEFRDRERIRCINELIEFFGKNTLKETKVSFLKGTWLQISGLISELMDEKYIDDQVQIGQIWDIVEALLRHGGFEKESWEVKSHILEDIYKNDLYDCYGISDPMDDLVNAMCTSREENLKRADIMMKAGLGSLAAKLYRECGDDDRCAEYFEKHLGKEEEPYEIMIDYYKERNYEKAVEIANQAIQKCRIDQTPFFIFLLQDAKENGNETAFKKLIQSARRRQAVKSEEIDAIFSQDMDSGK